MTIQDNWLTRTKQTLNENLDTSDEALKTFCSSRRNSLGLLNDDAKLTEEYKKLKANFDHDFQALRNFNRSYAKLLRTK